MPRAAIRDRHTDTERALRGALLEPGTLDASTRGGMVSLVTFIAKHKGEILDCWFDEASRSASARGLDGPAFRNLMPKYVSALANANDSLGEFTGLRRKYLESHLASRIRQGFQVEEVVDEFILVGSCAQRVWDVTPPDERPDRTELERLSTEVHRAAAAVTDAFAKHMAEDEQAEKRYLKRLQALASATVQHGAKPLRECLREALETIKEATAAQSAALLLYHPKTRELVNAASVGGAEMEGFVASVDPSSFAGQTASSDETTSIEDVPTTQLTIPDSLRRSGIQSLLGVRLPANRTLVGVLYIGIPEARPFTARESRRLEALGEQLTVHLDNAALFAELTDKLATLSSERAALRLERDMRERFVSVLAHDLRGPLTAAKFAAQLLIHHPDSLDQEGRKLATKVDHNIDRTDRMVRDLLDANRIHAGERLPIRLGEVDLAALARDVADELSALHRNRFIVHAEEHVPGFWSADELHRALWNLSTNAVKYGRKDAPIEITVSRSEKGVAIAVHNEGNPIPRDEQPDLYRQFWRARAAQAGTPRGWGLGLTLVHGCAEAHGGRVTLRSDSATGTTFTLEIPLDARPYQPQCGRSFDEGVALDDADVRERYECDAAEVILGQRVEMESRQEDRKIGRS